MLVLIQIEGTSEFRPIDVPDDETVLFLAQMIQAETNIQMSEQKIDFDGVILPLSDQALASFGIVDGSVVKLSKSNAPTQKRVYVDDIPANITAEGLLDLVRSHPGLIGQLKSTDKELADAVESNDISSIRMVLMSRYFQNYKRSYERQKEIEAIEADPMNEENQRKIEEVIKQKNIEQNMELAIENLPESFARVQMLYVNIFINDHFIKAFVDSGAQSTIMSAKCAERCNVMRLLDTRFAGEARGVGTAKILGKIHIAQMKFGNSYYPVSITVLETNSIDFLFGLDTLRRYNCIIDLSRNVLRINNGPDNSGQQLYEEMPFLADSEIPDSFGSSDSNANDLKPAAPLAPTSSISAPPATIHPGSSAPAQTSTSHAIISGASSEPTAANNSDFEANVSQLVGLGFSASAARVALQQAGGNVDLAASLLMENSS